MIDFLKKQLFTVHQNGKQQVSEAFKFIGPGIFAGMFGESYDMKDFHTRTVNLQMFSYGALVLSLRL